jgi:hypothetical protein
VTQVQAPEEIRQRYGLDHYYQLDVFLPLGSKVIRVADKDKKEEEQATIHGQYPVVCYAVHLPSELLPPEGGVSDEGTSRPVRISGTFYRLWSYQSEFMTSLADDQWQVAPLVMISNVEVTGKTNPYLGLVGGLSFLVLLGLIWWSQWRYSRTDQSFKRDTLNKRFELKPNQSLNDLGMDVADKPNFRNLP